MIVLSVNCYKLFMRKRIKLRESVIEGNKTIRSVDANAALIVNRSNDYLTRGVISMMIQNGFSLPVQSDARPGI